MTDHDSQKAAREAAAAFIQSAAEAAPEGAGAAAATDTVPAPEATSADISRDAAAVPSDDRPENAPAASTVAAAAADDGVAAAAPAPSQSAPSAGEASAATASGPAPAAPIAPEPPLPLASPAVAYGTVDAAKAQGGKRGGGALAVVITLAIIALVATGAVAYLFTSGFFAQEAPTQTQRVALADNRVEAAFNELALEMPDISRFAYVSQDSLIGPKFSDIAIGEPVNLGVSGQTVVQCTATATATYKNKGVEITMPVTLPFEYSETSETWIPGEATCGEQTATPLTPAAAGDIMDNLNAILAAHDATYSEAMAGASVVKTSTDLTTDGGPLTVTLSKQAQTQVDGKTVNEQRTSVVTLNVSWSNNEGWHVSVHNAGQIDYDTEQPADSENKDDEDKDEDDPTAGNSPASVDARANTAPDKLGEVYYGDSVSLSGTLRALGSSSALAQGNGHSNGSLSADADGRVQLVLELARPLELSINGTAYRLSYVAVAVAGLDDNGQGLVGRSADVQGPLEESFATSWSPIGIKALEIHVE